MEAELFGYARGAFSGAVQRYDGQLMAARGRHRLHGRNRRHAVRDAGEAAPRARGPRRQPPRRERVAPGGLPRHRRDEPRSAAADRSRARSAAISTSGSRLSPSTCCRCASGPRICRRWRATSSPASRASSRKPAPRASRGIRADAARALRRLFVAGEHPRAAQRAASRRWSTSGRVKRSCCRTCRSAFSRAVSGARRRTRRRSTRGPSPNASRAAASISRRKSPRSNGSRSPKRCRTHPAMLRARGGCSAASAADDRHDPGGTVRAMMRRLGVTSR